MGYYVDFDSLLAADLAAKNVTRSWGESVNTISDDMKRYTELSSFTGTAADNIRCYVQEVHGVSLGVLQEIMANYYTKISLYASGYLKSMDQDNHAVLPESDLQQVVQRFRSILSDIENQQARLERTTSSIRDLLPLYCPSSWSVESALEGALSIPKNLDERISSYEDAHLGDFSELDTMISTLRQLLNARLGGGRASVTSYQSGDIVKLTDCGALMGALNASMEYRRANVDKLQAASEMEALIIEELEKEAADQRLEQGIWSGIAAIGAITVGVVAIVATAGAATPAVVAGAFYVAGACSVAYGVSNLYEAGDNIYYGAVGDPYTAAFNPLRDTVFMGNQEVYDTWGSASMVVAGFAVPVNQAFNAAQLAGTTATMGSIGRVVAVEATKDALAGAAGGLAGQAATELTGNEHFGTFVGIGTGIVTSVILGKVDEKLNLSGMYDPNSLAANKQAKDIVSDARKSEPEITETMKGLEGDDSHLVGLEHRVKGEGSMTRKIYDDAIKKHEYAIADAPDNIGDSLRYTLVADEDNYEKVVRRSIQDLEDQGYKVTKFKNYWDDDTYKGINMNVQAPDGKVFELQFHTDTSFYTKETLNHKWYEIARSEASTQVQKDEATIIMQHHTSKVKIPKGALDLHY